MYISSYGGAILWVNSFQLTVYGTHQTLIINYSCILKLTVILCLFFCYLPNSPITKLAAFTIVTEIAVPISLQLSTSQPATDKLWINFWNVNLLALIALSCLFEKWVHIVKFRRFLVVGRFSCVESLYCTVLYNTMWTKWAVDWYCKLLQIYNNMWHQHISSVT